MKNAKISLKFYSIICCVLLSGCEVPWSMEFQRKCSVMTGSVYYDNKNRKAECYIGKELIMSIDYPND